MKTQIGGSLTLRQESTVSSEFHTQMLRQLEAHHDEKATDWTKVDPTVMVAEAIKQQAKWIDDRNPKRLVHAANFLTIAWAITESRNRNA